MRKLSAVDIQNQHDPCTEPLLDEFVVPRVVEQKVLTLFVRVRPFLRVKHACPTALDGDVIPQETVRFGAVRVETHGFITHGERGNLGVHTGDLFQEAVE